MPSRRRVIQTTGSLAFAGSALLTPVAVRGASVDVVVVGAGLSGLVCADRLAANGANVVVLEARDRVGGRTWGQAVAGVTVDAGAQWVGASQSAVLELAGDLGVSIFESHMSGRGLVNVFGFSVKVDEEEMFARSTQVRRAIRKLDASANELSTSRPWSTELGQQLDQVSVGAWLREHYLDDEGMIEIVVEVLGALNGNLNQSVLDMLWSVRSAGGVESLTDFSGGAQAFRLAGGAQSMSLKLAGKLSDAIRTSSPVDRVENTEAGVAVTTITGHRVAAKRLVVAMSPADCRRISFRSGLGDQRAGLHEHWQMSAGWKAHAVHERAFWRDNGLSGMSVHESNIVAMTFDNSPPEGTPGVLGIFIERSRAPAEPDVRRRQVIRALGKRFGRRARRPLGYVEQDWAAEVWGVGCTSPQPPGVLSAYGDALDRSIGPIHWAGTESATDWRGYMDGAVRAGRRAADEVVAEL